jgi:hypothetical protein
LVFLPNDNAVADGRLNLWRGFSVKPEEGKWPLMETHIRDIVAAGESTHARYILNWLAWCVQNPGRRAEVALVLRGGKGAGKGILGTTMLRIFGAHGRHISNRKHLVSGFNQHLLHCSFLFADEAYWPGDQSAEGELKRLITEPTLNIEPKGLDSFYAVNSLHLLISGNAEWVVPASDDERRYAVFLVSNEHANDPDYFTALHRELDNGGLEAMLCDLLHTELGAWHPRASVPQTAALAQQKEESLRGVDALVSNLIEAGCLPYPAGSHHPNTCLTSGEEKGEGLWAHAKRTVPSLKHHSAAAMSRALQHRWQCQSGWKQGGQKGITFLPLPELRQLYQAKFGAQPDGDPAVNWGD